MKKSYNSHLAKRLFHTLSIIVIISFMYPAIAQDAEPLDGSNPDPSIIKFDKTYSSGTRDADYMLDDGTVENSLGWFYTDLMWLNTFHAVPGAEVITSISLTFGALVPEGYTTRVILYNDPNNDSVPDDAVYLTEALVHAVDPDMNKFTIVPIEPTLVDSVFFVAGLHQHNMENVYPAAMDMTSWQDASWYVSTTTMGGFNVLDLSDPIHDNALAKNPFFGNWTLRAHGIGDIPKVCVLDLDVYKNSGRAMTVVFDSLMVDYHYYTFFPTGYLEYYDAAFVCLGTPDNLEPTTHVLTDAEGEELAGFLDMGGNLFMEGADTWYFDPQTSVHPYFNINGIEDGWDDTGPLAGVIGTFVSGMYFTYSGENMWMDRITAIPPAYEIFENQSPVYFNGVAFDAITYRTIGTSFEFGGLDDGIFPDTKETLMSFYLDFFGVEWPSLSATPTYYNFGLWPGSDDSSVMVIRNHKLIPQDWIVSIEYMDGPGTRDLTNKTKFPPHEVKDNIIPNRKVSSNKILTPARDDNPEYTPSLNNYTREIDAITDKGFAQNIIPWGNPYPMEIISSHLNNPGNVASLGQMIDPEYLCSAAWANGTWYGALFDADSLISIDTSTGIYTKIAKIPHANSMAWDPTTSTMYITDFDGIDSHLYTIDLVTGAGTFIGMPTGTLIIAMACTNEGTLYAIDMISDFFGSINKTNGAWTPISPLPLNASYAQDMSIDREDNMLYWASYSGGGDAALWIIDPATGLFYYAGDFEGIMEVAGFVIPSDPPANNWLTVSSTFGTIFDSFGSETISVYYNSTGLSNGDYYANIHVFNPWGGQTITIPVHLSVGSPEIHVDPTALYIHPTHDDLVPPGPPPESSGPSDKTYGEHNAYNVSPNSNNSIKHDYVKGRLLVQFRKIVDVDENNVSTNFANINETLRQIDARDIKRVFADNGIHSEIKEQAGIFSIYQINCPDYLDVKTAARMLENLDHVIYAEPDYIAYTDYVPPDVFYPDQWGFNNTGQAKQWGTLLDVGQPSADINAQKAWEVETGNRYTKVAIIDEGVDIDHTEFTGRVGPGWDFFNNDPDPRPYLNDAHGTACAGVALAAQDGVGVVGLAFNGILMAVKVMQEGSGPWSAISNGIVWSADQNADILSMSLGGSWYSRTLEIACNYANNLGCLLIAASGNDNFDNGVMPHYPASFSNVMSIGALSPCNDRKSPSTCDGEDWWGSNWGGGLDLLCPGTRCPTTDITGTPGYSTGDYTPYFNGTSCATPHAAGVAALILSHNPTLSPDAVRHILQNSCVDLGPSGYDEFTGHGRLDAHLALLLAGGANSFEIFNQGMGPLIITSMSDDQDWLSIFVPDPDGVVGGGMNGPLDGATWEEVVAFNDVLLYDNSSLRPSGGLAPKNIDPIILKNPNGNNRAITTKSFGYDVTPQGSIDPSGPMTFYLTSPGNVSPIGPPFPAGDWACCATWAEGIWYGITYYDNLLIKIDTTTGLPTTVGPTATADGLAWDPTTGTMYSCDVFTGNLYSINKATGAATFIGSSGIEYLAMAASNEGSLYAIEATTDNFGQIDKLTGAWTPIASVPFGVSFAMDLDFDREENLLYFAAFNNNTFAGELWTIDHITGSFTYLGTFEGGMQVAGFIVPTDLGRVIKPNESLLVSTFIDWNALGPPIPPRSTGTISIHSNDNDEPVVNVTVTPMSETIKSSSVLENDTVHSPDELCFEGQYVIIAGGDGKTFIVENGADAYLIAGRKIYLKPGVHVYEGGYMYATISGDGNYCSVLAPKTLVSTENEDEDIVIIQPEEFISVYPNPATGKINIDIHTENHYQLIDLQIFDFTGKEILGLFQVSDLNFEVDLESYNNGVYLIKVVQGDFSEIKKVVKQ